MKSLVLTLALLMCHILCAQKIKTSLELKTPADFISCDQDSNERNILLEKIENDQKKTIGTYQSKGCLFLFSELLAAGSYRFTVSGLAFQEEKVDFEINETNKGAIIFDPVWLKEKKTELNEVTVYSNRRQFVKVDSDKTTIDIKDNGMLNSGSSLDAVKKLPGVVKAPGGNLSLNGKGVRIYIDGAPSSLNGTDLENYLAALPANAIEKAELIYNPGAAFDANSSGSIINIITSSKRLKGINASFNVNYNFNKYQKPSPQILLNGKEKNLSWQTMLGVNYIENEHQNNTLQEFTSFTPSQVLDQKNLQHNTWRNVYWRTGTNYKLNGKSNLLFNYNMSLSNDRIDNTALTTGPGIDFENYGVTKAKTGNHELSLQYKLKLDTIGRTLDVTAYSNFFKKNPKLQSVSMENGDSSYNNSDINFKLENYYLKYDFAIPFKEWDFSINTGGKYNINKVRDLGRYNLESPSDDIFSSGEYASIIDFDYSENNLAFYGEARKKIKKFNITAGIRFEDYRVKRDAGTIADKIEYSNTNFFPNVNMLYEITKSINASASYNKKISQPGYFTIDPNSSSLFNKYNTSEGNLGLRPVFFDNYEFKITAFDYIQAGINYTSSKDNNQFIIEAKAGELISNRTFASFDKMEMFGAYLNFPIPLDYFFKGKDEFMKRMNAIDKMNYIFLNLNYNKTITEGYPLAFENKGTFNFGAQSQFLLPWGITNYMSYFFLPKGVWEIYRIDKPIQQFDISFNKDLMDKKLKLGIHWFDVFNANEVNAYVTGRNLNTHFYEKQDSRNFRISLTYNFGNLKLEKEDTTINTDKINQGGGLMK